MPKSRKQVAISAKDQEAVKTLQDAIASGDFAEVYEMAKRRGNYLVFRYGTFYGSHEPFAVDAGFFVVDAEGQEFGPADLRACRHFLTDFVDAE